MLARKGLVSKILFIVFGIAIGFTIILFANLQFASELRQGLRDADFGRVPPIGIYGPSAYGYPRR